MAICYDKLWKLLIDKKMNRTELKEASGISFNVLARLGKNEPVSFESIEKICFTLNCKIEDVVEIQKDEPIQIDSDAFTTIELFAGAGGLALGIEKAGFEPLGLIEFDKDAAESLKTNRPNWRVIHDDILFRFGRLFWHKKRRPGFIIGRGTVSGFFLCWKKIRT